jgi:hypothetical protein
MDVDTLEPGVDFVRKIEEAVASCDVLIAVIGTRWLLSSDDEGSTCVVSYLNAEATQLAMGGIYPVLERRHN